MRLPCLITGIVVALLFLTLLVTCRTIGLPLSVDATLVNSQEAPTSAQR